MEWRLGKDKAEEVVYNYTNERGGYRAAPWYLSGRRRVDFVGENSAWMTSLT